MSKFTFKKEKTNFQKSVSNITLPFGVNSMSVMSLSDYAYDETKEYATNDIVCIVTNDNPVWYVCSDDTTGEFDSTKWEEINVSAAVRSNIKISKTIANVDQRLEDIGESISDKIDGVETKVDGVNTKLVNLTNDVATVTTNLSTANRSINNISNDLTAVKEQTDKIPNIISAQSTCNNNLLAANTNINTVKNDVASIEASIGDLQECLDRLVPIDHDENGRNIESALASLVTV